MKHSNISSIGGSIDVLAVLFPIPAPKAFSFVWHFCPIDRFEPFAMYNIGAKNVNRNTIAECAVCGVVCVFCVAADDRRACLFGIFDFKFVYPTENKTKKKQNEK